LEQEVTAVALGVNHLVARWAHLYSDSKALNTGVTFAHFAGMLVGGGFAFVADRDAFRLSRDRVSDLPREIANMASVHAWVIGGLVVVIVTGLLMMLADLHTYLGSTAFWVKIGLFLLLMVNGYGRIRSEAAIGRGAARGWSWLRRTSLTSAVLWLAVLLVSTILTVSS
jgi:hypothetical protein